MAYESDPFPSYHELRNCSYSSKSIYTTSSSTHQVHLPLPGPTTAPTKSSPACTPTLCTANIWGDRPPFLIWSPDDSVCTPWWVGAPRLPLTPLPRGTSTICLNQVSSSSPWSVAPPSDGTPPGPSAFPPPPPSSCSRTRETTAPPPYTFIPWNSLLLLYFPAPLLQFPYTSELSTGFGRPPPNHFYCRRSSVLGMKSLQRW